MSDPLLSVRDLSVVFDVRPHGAWPWTPSRKLHAVSELSIDLQPGETRRIYFGWLGTYKLLTLVFCFAPWLALQIAF